MKRKTKKEALARFAREFLQAMQDEMESMKANPVWDLVDLPLGPQTIGNKWVLKIKRKVDRYIERYM
jgi:hypothetical protein